MLPRLLTVVLLSISSIQFSHADNSNIETFSTFDISLSNDEVINITRFGTQGDRILWIPSEYGVNKQTHYELMTAVARLQHEVWLAELHESYFIPPGRSSYTKIPADDLSELIQKSIPADNRKLFIVTTGRGAVLSLLALKNWQEKIGGSEKFGGIIMMHPNFQASTPAAGTSMEYLPIIDSVQSPVFIIQPKKSNKFWYLENLITRLSANGNQVYTKIIEHAGDGYHVRPDADAIEIQKRNELPRQVSLATRLLAKTNRSGQKNQTVKTLHSTDKWEVKPVTESLQPYPGNTLAPALELSNIDGKKFKLDDYRGKVIVLNYWATWCPPCVEEIPSLGRLQEAFSKNNLVVLSVDIGESKQELEAFLARIPADFPVLLDPEGITVKPWKIIALPTTFIIDQQGILKLAYFGGLQWDRPEVIAQLQKLIKGDM